MRCFRAKKLRVTLLAVLVLISLPIMAVDSSSFIHLGETDWNGTVFGDVGGDDIITGDNFEITQEDESYIMASRNNRGKFSSSTDGLAFLYQSIPSDKDFEMSVTVEVRSFEMNNQVSFGIMLRDTIYENMTTKENLGAYLACGPINITAEPPLTVFYRTMVEKTKKVAPMAFTAKPAAGSTIEISFIKEGDTYTLTYGDEDPFEIEDFTIFNGDELFIGMYTSRNTEVIFSDISLDIE